MNQLYTALVQALLLRYMDSIPRALLLNITDRLSSMFRWQRKIDVFKNLPSSVYLQLCTLSKLAYQGLRNNQQLIFSDLPASFETLDLLQEVPQLHHEGKGSASYHFLHLTVQEFLAALHIVHQRTRRQEKVLKGEVVFRCPTMEEEEVMLGGSDTDTDSRLSENDESGYEEMESVEKFCCHVCSRTKWTKTM